MSFLISVLCLFHPPDMFPVPLQPSHHLFFTGNQKSNSHSRKPNWHDLRVSLRFSLRVYSFQLFSFSSVVSTDVSLRDCHFRCEGLPSKSSFFFESTWITLQKLNGNDTFNELSSVIEKSFSTFVKIRCCWRNTMQCWCKYTLNSDICQLKYIFLHYLHITFLNLIFTYCFDSFEGVLAAVKYLYSFYFMIIAQFTVCFLSYFIFKWILNENMENAQHLLDIER